VRSIAVPICAALACLALLGAGTAAAEAKPSKATVMAVQEKLGIPADGVIGPQTRKAVRRFQRQNGLTVDGVIGPQTLDALGITARAANKPKRSMSPEALLEKIAICESGGDPTIVSRNGKYRGKYQFSRPTWRALGGKGDPAKASEAEQDLRAAALLERQGPEAWPHCSRVAMRRAR
jgi:peptidoglycan hydrolase-like protein with peptidoglycan-binding domain